MYSLQAKAGFPGLSGQEGCSCPNESTKSFKFVNKYHASKPFESGTPGGRGEYLALCSDTSPFLSRTVRLELELEPSVVLRSFSIGPSRESPVFCRAIWKEKIR